MATRAQGGSGSLQGHLGDGGRGLVSRIRLRLSTAARGRHSPPPPHSWPGPGRDRASDLSSSFPSHPTSLVARDALTWDLAPVRGGGVGAASLGAGDSTPLWKRRQWPHPCSGGPLTVDLRAPLDRASQHGRGGVAQSPRRGGGGVRGLGRPARADADPSRLPGAWGRLSALPCSTSPVGGGR